MNSEKNKEIWSRKIKKTLEISGRSKKTFDNYKIKEIIFSQQLNLLKYYSYLNLHFTENY